VEYSQGVSACQLERHRKVDSWWHKVAAAIWPPHCVLCEGIGANGRDLCVPCEHDLPLNTASCRVCAQPLALGRAEQAICGRCLGARVLVDASFVPYRYAYPLDRLIQRLKYGKDLSVTRVLGDLFAEHWLARSESPAPQLLVPVPLGYRRYCQRGFNQARELARVIARRCGIPMRSDLVERSRETKEQAALSRRGRKRNVRGAFRMKRALPARHIAIIDDVVTTGSTVNELARVLRRAGATTIAVWALARAGR